MLKATPSMEKSTVVDNDTGKSVSSRSVWLLVFDLVSTDFLELAGFLTRRF